MSLPAPLPWPAQVARTTGALSSAGVPHPGRMPAATGDTRDSLQLRAQFTAACHAVGGTVHDHLDLDALIVLIERLGVEHQVNGADAPALLTWAAEFLPVPGILEACAARGLAVLDSTVRSDADGHRDDMTRLDTAAVGLTGALSLLADTGSVVVASGPGRPRLASLLPPVHIVLATEAQLVPSLGAWVEAHPNGAAACANLVVITGPSRTADIEMTLTRGVHGPRAVHVVFVA